MCRGRSKCCSALPRPQGQPARRGQRHAGKSDAQFKGCCIIRYSPYALVRIIHELLVRWSPFSHRLRPYAKYTFCPMRSVIGPVVSEKPLLLIWGFRMVLGSAFRTCGGAGSPLNVIQLQVTEHDARSSMNSFHGCIDPQELDQFLFFSHLESASEPHEPHVAAYGKCIAKCFALVGVTALDSIANFPNILVLNYQ